MYVILYQPEKADPEVFGPYTTPTVAANALHRISTAAGVPIDVTHSALLASIDVVISGERHRYQLLKMGSTTQLDIHAEIIAVEHEAGTVEASPRPPDLSPTRLSGY